MNDNTIPDGAILMPTMLLRWIEENNDEGQQLIPLPRLQQAWHDRATGAVEWRDVETVRE